MFLKFWLNKLDRKVNRDIEVIEVDVCLEMDNADKIDVTIVEYHGHVMEFMLGKYLFICNQARVTTIMIVLCLNESIMSC